MSNRQMTFVDLCLEGSVAPSEIDDFVDRWHEGDSRVSIETFLGFTQEEYACWVEEPWTLRSILFSRKTGHSLTDSLKWAAADKIAARSNDLADADTLQAWLQRTGRLRR